MGVLLVLRGRRTDQETIHRLGQNNLNRSISEIAGCARSHLKYRLIWLTDRAPARPFVGRIRVVGTCSRESVPNPDRPEPVLNECGARAQEHIP
jgi:hypothetical protein